MAKEPKKADVKKGDEEQEVFAPPPRPELPSKDGRNHRASYAKDKMKGGYNIRVVGPSALKMGHRWLPVTRVDGSENMEFTMDIVYSGKDDDTGQPLALFTMWKAPKETEDEIPF